ncbi:hypothetical protein TIFTF001_032101 [Ficus carica]|uniref:B-like cyclin n=1 Tax=Ficus carica TaxID=3494 RepID=A0AA88J6A1_FICCA|nr:hypothetical protein TIFTF001_032101 [Ficus carica]
MEADMYDPLDPYDVCKNKTTYLELHFNPLDPLPTKDNESKHETYFELESSYMPRSGYYKNRDTFLFRNRAVLLISKYRQCDNFPFIAYLAMNYFDRYITRENLVLNYPRLIQHGVDIIAFAWLTIAWKMKDLNFSTTRFLAERPELAKIPPEQLVSTEISILNELNWNMRAVTPFCFVPYFCDKLKAKNGFRPRTICEIIVHAQDGIWIMELKPSIVAISAFLAASHYLYPGEINQFLCEPILKNTLPRGAMLENPSIPTFKVQTGQRYRGTDKGEQNPPASQYEKGKGKMWEIVEDREDQQDQGKNKVDMYRVPEIPKMAEDSEEVQFSFQLRWRSPLRNLAVVIIFKYSQGKNFDPLTGFMAMNYFDRYAASSDQLDEFTPDFIDIPVYRGNKSSLVLFHNISFGELSCISSKHCISINLCSGLHLALAAPRSLEVIQ